MRWGRQLGTFWQRLRNYSKSCVEPVLGLFPWQQQFVAWGTISPISSGPSSPSPCLCDLIWAMVIGPVRDT